MPRKAAGRRKEEERDILYVFSYVLIWVSGIIVFIIARPSQKRLRFNALQATILGAVVFVLLWVPLFGWFIAFVLWLIGVIAGAKAYNGEDVELPVIGSYARRHSG